MATVTAMVTDTVKKKKTQTEKMTERQGDNGKDGKIQPVAEKNVF